MFDMGGYGSGARFLIETAVKKRDLQLAEWVLARGANPNAAPARDKRFPKRSLYELALIEDLPEMAELLARYGASRSTPALDETRAVHRRVLPARSRSRPALLLAHPEYLQSPSCDVRGREARSAGRARPPSGPRLPSRSPGSQTGKRALHEAAASGALRAAAFLLERGAEIDPRESTTAGTPIGWAAHGDNTEMVRLLSRYSRDIWTLCFNGYVDRVREILAEDPRRAQVVGPERHHPAVVAAGR